MKRSERVGILSETILNALNEWQSNLYTAMPGIVIDIDTSKCPVLKVQPAINRIYTNPRDGSKSWIKMPILLDVPLLMYGGGGITLTCPVAIGDVCLCVCVCVFIYIYTCTHILAQEMQRLKTRRQGKLRLHTGLHNAHLNSNIRDCFFAPLLFLVVIGSFAFYFEVRLPFWLKSFPRPPEPRLPPCQQGLGQFRGEEMGATFYPACVSPKSYHRCTRLPQNASHDLHALL